VAIVYRRKRSKDTWHFCSNCRHWPRLDYESRTEKPKSGEFCDECKSKRAKENCKWCRVVLTENTTWSAKSGAAFAGAVQDQS